MLVALAFIGANVVLVGVASFLESPLSRRLDAFRLGAALRLGGLILAVVALLAGGGPVIPDLESGLAGLGIGVILGVGSAFYCLALVGLAPWLAASAMRGSRPVRGGMGGGGGAFVAVRASVSAQSRSA